jgi:hypothetical protein
MYAQGNDGTGSFGKRLGGTIGTDDRDYFGLFPTITSFSSASGTARGDGGIDIVVRRQAEADTALQLTSSQATALRAYLNDYELLFLDPSRSVDWKGLAKLVRPSRPFSDGPITLAITTATNEEVRGTLLYADSAAVVIAPNAGEYLRAPDRAVSRVLLTREILRITDDQGFFGQLFSEFDVPIAANDTMYRVEALPILRRQQLFQPYATPEIRHAMIERQEGAFPAAYATSTEELRRRLGGRKFHLSVAYGGLLGMPQSSFTVSPYQRPSFDRSVLGGSEVASIGVEYSLLKRLRLGVGYTFHATPALPTDSSLDYERISGNELEAVARIVLVTRGDFLRDFAGRFEIVAGVGGVIRPIGIDYRITSPFGSDYQRTGNESQTATGGVVLLGGSYYTGGALSLDLEARYTSYGDLVVEQRTLLSRLGDYTLKTQPRHEIALGGIGVRLGLRMHL